MAKKPAKGTEMAISRVIGCLVLLSCLAACDSNSVPRAQYEAKATEVEQLRKELDDIKNGPSRSLAESKADLAKGEFKESVNAGQRVLTRYPLSPEAAEATAVVQRAESSLAAAQAAEEKARSQALSGMVKERDDISRLTFWRDKSMPTHVYSRSWVGAYLVTDDGVSTPSIRMVVYFRSDDWLFIEKYIFKIDDDVLTLSPSEFGGKAVQRDNGDGGVWEWWDVLADRDELSVLERLSTAKQASIRYEGKQYKQDRIVGTEERAAIKRTLLAYETLKAAK